MEDNRKTKEQLINELESLRQQAAEMEERLKAARAPSAKAFELDEGYYRLLSDMAYDFIWLWDISLNRFLYISPSVEKLLNFTVEEAITQTLSDALLPESMRLLTDELPRRIKALESGDETARVKTYELDQKCKDGSLVFTEVVTTFLTDPAGKVTHIHGITRNINERKRMEFSIRQNEEKYRIVADFAIDWEYWISPGGQIIYMSPSSERITGYDLSDFFENPGLIEQIVHPDDRDIFAGHVDEFEINPSKAPRELEFRIIAKNGSIVWLEHRCQPVYLFDGSFGGIRASNSDISRLKRAEEALKSNERQLSAILEATTETVFLMDKDCRFIKANHVTAERIGTDLGKLMKEGVFDRFPPDVAEYNRGKVRQAIETKKPLRFENEFQGRIIINSIYPIIEKDNDIRQLAVFTTDITEEKHAHDALEESRASLAEANLIFKTVIDTIPVRIFWKDKNSLYLGCNRLFAKDIGRNDPADVIGKDDYHMPWMRQADLFRKIDNEVITLNQVKKEYKDYRRMSNGENLWVTTTKVPLHDLNGDVIGVLGIYDDITEKKRIEDLLKESEERYRSIFNNNYAIQMIIDSENGRIMDANPAACSYYGYDANTMKSMHIADLNTMSREQLFEEMSLAKAEKRNHLYFSHRLANGEIRQIEVYSGPVIVNGKNFLYSIVHDISERKKAEEEREQLILDLQAALSKIKKLSGMLPICASCKKIRDDKGYWNQIESYIRDHSEAEFSHSICPDCIKKLYPDFICSNKDTNA